MGPRPLTLGFRYLFLFGLYAASLRRPDICRLLGMPSVLQAASSLCPAYFSPESTKKAAHVGDRWWISSAYVCYQFVIVGCKAIIAAATKREHKHSAAERSSADSHQQKQ